MMYCDREDLRQLTDIVRRNFQLLATLADRIHEDLSLPASCRAILEHLQVNGPSTVPQIASAKSVKRQSIQELVDRLLDRKLVKLERNPGHQRSHLIGMTDDGAALIALALRREHALLDDLSVRLGNEIAIHSAIDVLDRVRTAILDTLAAQGAERRAGRCS